MFTGLFERLIEVTGITDRLLREALLKLAAVWDAWTAAHPWVPWAVAGGLVVAFLAVALTQLAVSVIVVRAYVQWQSRRQS